MKGIKERVNGYYLNRGYVMEGMEYIVGMLPINLDKKSISLYDVDIFTYM